MAQEPIQKQPGLLELLDEWEKQGASDAEITLWMSRYLRNKAREEDVPLHGSFELTPLCNLDCKMCYVHLSEKQLHESGKQLLAVEEWKDIMRDAIDAGMISAMLTGGECLTYPGFDELYLFLQERGIETTIKSNGLLMTEKRVDFFKAHPPAGIQITLYGADDDSYEAVTGVRCFEPVFAGIQRLKEAGIVVSISITPTKHVLPKLEALLTTTMSLDLPFAISSGLFSPRKETGRNNDDMGLSLDEYISVYKIRNRINGRELIPVCEEDIPLSGQAGKPVMGLPCGGGRSGFAIHWNGCMYPCLSLNSISADLREHTFDEAWQMVNAGVKAYMFPGECIECEYRRICTPCIVHHEQGGDTGHCNTAFCERSRRMVMEGLTVRKK